MAGEITGTITAAINKGGQLASISWSESDTLAGSGCYGDTQVIGTSAEAITFPSDLTTEGVSLIVLFNDDSANYVQIALDSGMTQVISRIPPKRGIKLRPDTGSPTLYARANTAAIVLRKVAAGT